MIKINNIKLKPEKLESNESLLDRLITFVCKKYSLNKDKILSFKLVKKSIDARKKNDISIICTVLLTLPEKEENIILKKDKSVNRINEEFYNPVIKNEIKLNSRPVIVGMGPAGLFCAYILVLNGLKPIIVERGKKADERKIDVEEFWADNKLNANSNVSFGEGGAGTFSDGKLNTQIKDKSGRIAFVLKTLVKFGADEDIIFESKPHVGTDQLINIVTNIREELISMGATIYFNTRLIDIELADNKVSGALVKNEEEEFLIKTDNIVLCIGHSARDTFALLKDRNVSMTPKNFAVGFRVIHSQKLINHAQYGDFDDYFPAAPYKLTFTSESGRGVFSFCNCPGGYVVNASSEDGKVAVNGMSYHDRASEYANSAIIVQVSTEDFNATDNNDPLIGVYYQQEIEKKAYLAGDGFIPVQRFADYENNTTTEGLKSDLNCIKGRYKLSNLRTMLNPQIEASFIEAMHDFGKKIEGFDDEDVIMAGIESRTSSPVRINRDDYYQSNITGLYPGGEGAGYAGGITSAAVDGIKVAEALMHNYGKIDN